MRNTKDKVWTKYFGTNEWLNSVYELITESVT